MLDVLLRTKIESDEHLTEMIELAKQMKLEYGHKGNYFFIQVEIDEHEKIEQNKVYSDPETS